MQQTSTFYQDNAISYYKNLDVDIKQPRKFTSLLYQIDSMIESISTGHKSTLVTISTSDQLVHYIERILENWATDLEKNWDNNFNGSTYNNPFPTNICLEKILEHFEDTQVVKIVHWRYFQYDKYIMTIKQIFVNPE